MILASKLMWPIFPLRPQFWAGRPNEVTWKERLKAKQMMWNRRLFLRFWGLPMVVNWETIKIRTCFLGPACVSQPCGSQFSKSYRCSFFLGIWAKGNRPEKRKDTIIITRTTAEVIESVTWSNAGNPKPPRRQTHAADSFSACVGIKKRV